VAKGDALPDEARFLALVAAQEAGAALQAGHPYPFFLAHQVDVPLAQFDERLGPVGLWFAEWKYDGIRAQVIKRAGEVWIW
ncbi:ATP-dependent DNA ligase, partial [Escherichia coli]|nr:ATP-dependent DNA ligase [Escherichia coli]